MQDDMGNAVFTHSLAEEAVSALRELRELDEIADDLHAVAEAIRGHGRITALAAIAAHGSVDQKIAAVKELTEMLPLAVG